MYVTKKNVFEYTPFSGSAIKSHPIYHLQSANKDGSKNETRDLHNQFSERLKSLT